ncbi:glycosyltransferase family 1 protein [Acinetobacter sp. ANC 4635]|uniref:glycosyltransferase family 4 protein n=1 Tax=Acinetobacter sp. ANC 4635 TaxID=2529846 RepID=UPI001040AD19|nr:glycosyltransferase family 4 protein [Acinetobacter sp. ANC 4635]TCB33498.1 glycosyltransferase family 1 protein [Acinetobacter sp. ANC 4635]
MNNNILIITRNLPPLVGGMERLNWHIADELSKQNKVTMISHSAAKKLAPENVKFYEAPLSPLPLFLILSFIRAFWICMTQPTDTLFAGSGLTAPIVVILAKVFRKKSIIYIHGLDIGTNNKIYNLCWVPFIRQADQVIANSSPTYRLCIQKNISKEKISIIHPGVSYPPKPKNEKIIQILREKYNLNDKKVLISVGRLTERKGMNEFIDLCLSKVVNALPDTVLIIIGDTPNQSLNKNLQSKELILTTAKKHNLTNNIIFTGNIQNDDILASFYYLADLHVFPVKHIPHDPEGFGMVAIEAAAHGTPTVAFATGGIVDAVKQDYSGLLITPNGYDLFTNTILDVLRTQIISADNCQQYAAQFSWQSLNKKLEQAMK